MIYSANGGSVLYRDVKVRSINEIENEIVRLQAFIIKKDDFTNMEVITAIAKVRELEWVLGVIDLVEED